jgi:hypothetical protein
MAVARIQTVPPEERSLSSDCYYRIYDLDHRGAIVGASNRPFADDAEAMAHAGQLLAHRPGVEVWQTDRLVGRLEQRQSAQAMSA